MPGRENSVNKVIVLQKQMCVNSSSRKNLMWPRGEKLAKLESGKI